MNKQASLDLRAYSLLLDDIRSQVDDLVHERDFSVAGAPTNRLSEYLETKIKQLTACQSSLLYAATKIRHLKEESNMSGEFR